MTAAAVIGMLAAQGARQVAASALPALLTALACVIPTAIAIRILKRRTRITHLVTLPPGEELGDDVIAMIRQARERDRTEAEADADFEREIDEMTRRYGNG